MSLVHLHLIINHLPMFGSLLGSLVLTYGMWVNSEHTKIAGFGLLITSAIAVIVAYVSGEGAEETVEKISGVSKQAIEAHASFALYTMIALILTGVTSIVGFVLSIRKSPLVNILSVITLVIAIVGFGLSARTEYQGGQIRHTELNTAGVNAIEGNNNHEKRDKN